MKRFFIAVMFFIFPMRSLATMYYVSSAGNDTNNGTSTGTPWRTIAHVNAQSFSPGDSILFNRSNTWHEKLVIPSSGSSGNSITFGAYGSGALPTLDGADVLSGWTNTSGNVWQVAWTQASNQVIRNGVRAVKESSQGALTANYEWFYNGSSTLFIYTSTNPNTDSSSWEGGNESRYDVIAATDKSYVTVDSLNVINSDEIGGSSGIAWSATTGTVNGITISNSTITNNYQFGIQFYDGGSFGFNGITLPNDTATYNFYGGGTGGYGQIALCAASNSNQCSNVTITNPNFSYGGVHGAAGVTPSATNGLYLDNCQTCTISGFTFNYNGSSGGNVQNGSNGVTYTNGTATFNGQAGSVAGGDNDGLDIGDLGNGSSNITITKSYLCNNQASAITIASTNTNQVASNVTISYNQLCGSTRTDGNGQGLQIGGGHTGVVVEYNLIYGNADWGYSHTEGTSGDPAVLFYGNTVYGNGIGGVNTSNIFIDGNSLTLKNNIVAQATGFELRVQASNTYTSDYNDFYNSAGSNFMSYYGTSYTFSGYQSAATEDAHSISSNPLFANPGTNFSLLNGSPAIDSGVNLGSPYQNALAFNSSWPNGIVTGNQNNFGTGWEMGAYLFGLIGTTITPGVSLSPGTMIQ